MSNPPEGALQESPVSALSKEARKSVIQSMADNFDAQDEPKVGIFWYDSDSDELFGVTAVEACDIPFDSQGRKTVRMLHKTWWKKQQQRAKAKGQEDGKFITDYTQIPRGKIFQTKSGVFELMCGSWITESIIDLVKDEFNLYGIQLEVKIDTHWEIGHGWNEENAL